MEDDTSCPLGLREPLVMVLCCACNVRTEFSVLGWSKHAATLPFSSCGFLLKKLKFDPGEAKEVSFC